ncbi:MAG: hypothetical protein Kow006_31070 [Gammaproteobacteria bacterium]
MRDGIDFVKGETGKGETLVEGHHRQLLQSIVALSQGVPHGFGAGVDFNPPARRSHYAPLPVTFALTTFNRQNWRQIGNWKF